MTPSRLLLALAAIAMLAPAAAEAQLYGAVEFVLGRGYVDSGVDRSPNNDFDQNYTVGFRSSIWDQRFLRYDGNVTFRRTNLVFGEKSGSSNDFGFAFNGTFFNSRSFPLTLQVSRNQIAESGDFPSASIIRGGLTFPPGQPMPDFLTRRSGIDLNWQLTEPRLPQVQLTVRKVNWNGSGGGESGTQREDQINANVEKTLGWTRHTFRYLKNAIANETNSLYDNGYSNLSYEMATTRAGRTRGTVQVGRRTSYSLFDVPSRIVDPGLPGPEYGRRGSSLIRYAQGSVTYDATSRLSADVMLGAEREDLEFGSAGSLLASAGARLLVGKGLSVNGQGAVGLRDQRIQSVERNVRTATWTVGADYVRTINALTFSAGGHRTAGTNEEYTGETGETNGWFGRADVGTAFSRGVNLRAGYERGQTTDNLLETGNQDLERVRLSAHSNVGSRVSLEATWEDSSVVRGRTVQLEDSRFMIASGTAHVRVTRRSTASIAAGQFTTTTLANFADERRAFAFVSFDATLAPALMLRTYGRGERTEFTSMDRDQIFLEALAILEYKLRFLTCALEYRYTESGISQAGSLTRPSRGNRVLLRISRRFGW